MNKMVFRNYGGIYQLRTDLPEDLEQLKELEVARWAITSAPRKDFQCDPRFLEFLDAEQTGRIRVEHLWQAQAWAFKLLKNRDCLARQSDELQLGDLDTSHPEGAALESAARWVLSKLSPSDRGALGLKALREFRAQYALTYPNGDGVLPAEFVEPNAPEAAALIRRIMKHVGQTLDLSGKGGITEEHLDLFLKRARAWLDWEEEGQPQDPAVRGRLYPWGEGTLAAIALIEELGPKIDQYFAQCDLVELESKAAGRLAIQPTELWALKITDPGAIQERLKAQPLALPRPGASLPLEEQSGGTPLNPAYRARLAEFRTTVLKGALGISAAALGRAEWLRIRAEAEPYAKWKARQPEDTLREIPSAELKSCLAGPLPAQLRTLVKDDLAAKGELEQLKNLEKLILYQRWLLVLANNFVNVSHLYDPAKEALFERGKLVIDGREISFTMGVENRPEHKKIAMGSSMFVIYAEVTDRLPSKDPAHPQPVSFEIAAAVTAGEQGGIEIGKRGVFLDAQGKVWDARVVDLVSNPISIWEAVKAPFQRAGALVFKKVEGLVAGGAQTLEKVADKKIQELDKPAPVLAGAPPAPPPAPAPAPAPAAPPAAAPASSNSMRDWMVGGGIAFAAVGSSLAFILKTVSDVDPRDAAVIVVGVILAVMLFSALLGYLKLRRRNMATLLEASGWAVNFRLKLTHSLGLLFTRQPGLPKEARKERGDALARFLAQAGQRKFSWRRFLWTLLSALLVTGAVLAWRYFELLQPYLPAAWW